MQEIRHVHMWYERCKLDVHMWYERFKLDIHLMGMGTKKVHIHMWYETNISDGNGGK